MTPTQKVDDKGQPQRSKPERPQPSGASRLEEPSSQALAAIREELARQKAEIEALRQEKNAVEAFLTQQIEEHDRQQRLSEQRMQERFREIAGLTRMLQERDKLIADQTALTAWLQQVISIMTRQYGSSLKTRLSGIVPFFFIKMRQRSLLKRNGLFDADDYLAMYPDVSGSSADPLRHYVNHGIMEGRVLRQRS